MESCENPKSRFEINRDIPSETERNRSNFSASGTALNFDFNVSFTPEQVKSGVRPYNYGKYKMKIDEKEGASAFYRDKNGDIYHTYSTYERGIDLMNTTYNFLDLTAKGRDENPDATQDWVRYHDEYKDAS